MRRHKPSDMGLPEAAPELTWRSCVGGYELPDEEGTQVAALTSDGGDWHMMLKAPNGRYGGRRPDLETAVKALSNLMHKETPSVWLRANWSVVLAPWQGDLTERA